MTDTWTACQITAAWLESNKVNASPLAIIALTNLILQSIDNARKDAYLRGRRDARKDNGKCKQF